MTYGNCGDCEFWKGETIDPDSGDMLGQCRLNPPVFVPGFKQGAWPVTDHYDGCGQNVPLAALVEAREAEAKKWERHPIETAPRDGTKIDAYDEDGKEYVLVWWSSWESWRTLNYKDEPGPPPEKPPVTWHEFVDQIPF